MCSIDKCLSDLKNMLKSKNRIVRKRAFEYIVNDQNGLEINTKEFLSLNGIDSNIVSREKFPLADLPTLYPSIFAEIYLWLNIRGDYSAILGSNIYDIDKENSLDVLNLASLTIIFSKRKFNNFNMFEFKLD